MPTGMVTPKTPSQPPPPPQRHGGGRPQPSPPDSHGPGEATGRHRSHPQVSVRVTSQVLGLHTRVYGKGAAAAQVFDLMQRQQREVWLLFLTNI